jgi:hypothetical protein
MRRLRGTLISVHARVRAPIGLAWQILLATLEDLQAHPGAASLEADWSGVLGVSVSAPIKVTLSKGNSRYELEIAIEPSTNERFFPHFHGVIALLHNLADTCDLRLDGKYSVPLGGIGKTIDATLLRDVARASLKRFIEHLAENITNRIKIAL